MPRAGGQAARGGTATPMSIVGQCPCMAEVRGDTSISTTRVTGDGEIVTDNNF